MGLCGSLFAQTTNLTLTALETNGAPIKNTEIKLVEIETRKEVSKTTNAEGKVKFTLDFGSTWQIQLRDIKHYYMWQVEMPSRGTRNRTMDLVYNTEKYERSLRPPVDREALNLKVVEQSVTASDKPDDETTVYTIILLRKDNRPLGNFPVQMTNYDLKTTFSAVTNAKGEARFRIPRGREYEIDIEGINSYKFANISDRKNIQGVKRFLFEPMNFTEKTVNDTVLQELDRQTNGTSGRYFLTATFKERNTGKKLLNQTVVISALEDGTSYSAKTDAEGKAKFMLPKGKHYIFRQKMFENFYYETEVCDLSRHYGVGKGNRPVYVMPSTELPNLPKGFKLLQPDPTLDWNTFFEGQNIKVSGLTNLSTPYYARNHVAFIDEANIVDIDRGFLITSGSFMNAFGPNDSPGASALNSLYKATNLPKSMVKQGEDAFDPCFLSLEVTPEHGTLELSYVFASEEYPEYPEFDDAFGIFIEGAGFDEDKNQAMVPGTATFMTVTQLLSPKYQSQMINNEIESNPSFLNWQYDGFTQKITRSFQVTPGQTYRVKLVVLDRLDGIYDTGVFVGMRSVK